MCQKSTPKIHFHVVFRISISPVCPVVALGRYTTIAMQEYLRATIGVEIRDTGCTRYQLLYVLQEQKYTLYFAIQLMNAPTKDLGELKPPIAASDPHLHFDYYQLIKHTLVIVEELHVFGIQETTRNIKRTKMCFKTNTHYAKCICEALTAILALSNCSFNEHM